MGTTDHSWSILGDLAEKKNVFLIIIISDRVLNKERWKTLDLKPRNSAKSVRKKVQNDVFNTVGVQNRTRFEDERNFE